MIPLARFAVPFVLVALVVACTAPTGGTGSSGAPSGSPATSAATSAAAGTCPTTPPPQGTPEGWDVASQHPSVLPEIINPPGTIACGANRLVFSFLDAKNVPIAKPDRTVDAQLFDLGADPKTPVAQGTARFIWAIEPTVGVYVLDIDLKTAGTYGIEFKTAAPGSPEETIRSGFDVQPTSSVVAVGDQAPASDTPDPRGRRW